MLKLRRAGLVLCTQLLAVVPPKTFINNVTPMKHHRAFVKFLPCLLTTISRLLNLNMEMIVMTSRTTPLKPHF